MPSRSCDYCGRALKKNAFKVRKEEFCNERCATDFARKKDLNADQEIDSVFLHLVPVLTPEIGKRIRIRRKELRITQQVMADSLGVSQSAISKIERGKCGIYTAPMARFAMTLQTTPRALLLGA